MSISEDYKRQFRWRAWPTILERLPSLEGKLVLDVGCGVGDQAELLAERGARVLGFDGNEELLKTARSRKIANVEFRLADLRQRFEVDREVDGVWSSFTAAYFPVLEGALANWTENLRPGGWVAVVEVDDFFAHRPLEESAIALLDAYADDGVDAGRYDFRMGRKLAGSLEKVGFTVQEIFTVADRELSFQGPAEPEVLDAWRKRFERMQLLRGFCGDRFEGLRDDFLGCLARADHRPLATVCCCLATKPAG